jgi:hypothetical protein
MAILQGIISLVGRSAGRICSALFDRAVVALFGRVGGRSKTWLSALMAAAAAWPILPIGARAPTVAVLVIAFVPLSDVVSTNALRAIWIALLLLVPIVVGVVLRMRSPPDHRRRSWIGSIGVLGLALAAALARAGWRWRVAVPLAATRKAVTEDVQWVKERVA